ncbi:hypothetical protein IV487_00265 [Enterococcus saccharolyticus]|uniref:Uncharacterized protein n=1 Tax=Candidatus Enterococcus willemsii TaxID=1857215 RepID=A0ABQ6YXG9_9ENTE|nr:MULTISPECIES: hypothetical protein [Enterococcus]KAF1302595.1 hypothetical protein BAU17_13700 [Enterococcus sp. CU12B]MCD5000907.1 hypothetical protein [Enterococcus saccharolyticus]
MKAVRRFGFIIGVLLIGIIIGNFGMLTAVLIVCPLFILWLMLWDDKKFRQAERRRNNHQLPPDYYDYYHYE